MKNVRFPNLMAEQARRGLSNQEVAKALNTTKANYEYRRRNGSFSVTQARTLCDLFGVTFDYLFTEES